MMFPCVESVSKLKCVTVYVAAGAEREALVGMTLVQRYGLNQE